MEEKRSENISLRITPSLDVDLKKISKETSITPTTFAYHALCAVNEYYKANKQITVPFVIVPKKEYEDLISLNDRGLVAEKGTKYRAQKK